MSLGDFLGGVGEVIQTGIQTAPAIIQALQGQPVTAQPFGGFPLTGLPDIPRLSLAPSATAAGVQASGACPQFVPTRTRMRAVQELRAINPSTGKIESWTHRGSPLVWSGDRAIAKKYAKAAGFSMRRRGRAGGRACATRRTTRRK